MSAAQFELNNLTLIIDHNRFQQGAAISKPTTSRRFARSLKHSAGR